MAARRRLTRRPPFRPLAYRPGNSPVHRLPAAAKLLGLCAVSALIFVQPPPPFCPLGKILAGLAILGAAVAARLRPRDLVRGLRPLLVMAAFVALLRAFDLDDSAAYGIAFNARGLAEGLVFALCLALSFAAGSLLFLTSSLTDILESLNAAEFFLRHPARSLRGERGGDGRISLGIALMFGFIRTFFELWESAATAWDARAGARGVSRVMALAAIVAERMLLSAVDTAKALMARGVGVGDQ